MDKIISVVKLMAKTGLFFANCDGQYDQRERDYIENFISGMESVGDIEPTLKQSLRESLNQQYTFDQIVNDTKALTDGFNEDERKVILITIDQFIRKVIRLDGELCEKEKAHYESWQKTFGLA
jgi:hypothetical protein